VSATRKPQILLNLALCSHKYHTPHLVCLCTARNTMKWEKIRRFTL